MDTEKYQNWNNAFRKYFFEDKEDGEEIFLFVNEDIINQIGESNGLGNTDEFLSVVLVPKDDRYDALGTKKHGWRKCGANLEGSLKDNYESSGIFRFAYALSCDSELSKNFCYCPYLNYIILVVYLAGLAQQGRLPFKTQENIDKYNRPGVKIRNAIVDYIKEYIGDGETCGFDYLENLFAKLHATYPDFKNYNFTGKRYVGLLKYQLIVSSAQIRQIEDAIYEHGFDFSEWDSYERIVNILKDHVDSEIKKLLKSSLNSKEGAPYRKRLEGIIRNFDAEKYAERNTEKQRKFVGSLYRTIYFGDDQARLILLTDVRAYSLVENNSPYTIIAEETDSIRGLNPNHVLINGKDCATMIVDSYNGHEFNLKAFSNGVVVFFEKYNENYYIETKQLSYNTTTYIALKNSGSGRADALRFIETSARNCRKLNVDLLGDDWTMYSAAGFKEQYYKDTVFDRVGKLTSPRIVMRGGITSPQKKEVYLVSALPYFEFPIEINENNLSVKVNIEGRNAECGEDYKSIIVGRKLIIDILNYDLSREFSDDLEVTIEYKSEEFSDSLKSFFSICGQPVSYQAENLKKYDRWGQIASVDSTPFISGNAITGVDTVPLTGTIQKPETRDFVLDEDMPKFYFIHLLAANLYLNTDYCITRKTLEKCIRYTATRTGVDYLGDEHFVRHLRNALINGGYICADYSGSRPKYQAIPPLFAKLPRAAQTDNTASFTLTGCFTRQFMTDLLDYCDSNNVSVKIEEKNRVSSSNVLDLFPPAILLGGNFQVEEFRNACDHQFEYIDGTEDRAMEMLRLSHEVTSYKDVLGEQGYGLRLEPVKDERFPRVVTSLAGGYRRCKWIELNEGEYRESTINDFDWMEVYCRYAQEQKVLWKRANEVFIPRKFALPYLVKRALFMMNRGLPDHVKAFIVDSPFVSSEPLFTTFRYYLIGVDNGHADRLAQVLTGSTLYDNDRVVSSNNYLDCTIKLFTRKDGFKTTAKYIMYIKAHFDEFLATRDSVYVKHDGQYRLVDGRGETVNEQLSKFIKNRNNRQSWEQLGIRVTTDVFPHPELLDAKHVISSDEYTEEQIKII